jgi:membrane protease YdiL (CAAX protease family)
MSPSAESTRNERSITLEPTHRSPTKFFILVFVFSIPFYLLGGESAVQILPGIPISALAFVAPVGVASYLVFRENGTKGVRHLLRRSYDFDKIHNKLWYIPIFFTMPAALVLSYIVMRWMGISIPLPQVNIVAALVMFIVFFIEALGEELGWMGYAIDPMQARSNALIASLLLGLVWAMWHLILLIQTDRSPQWIAWWTLGTVSQRVLIVWIYNNTGKSVFSAAVVHATGNLSWQLFPISGSYYDPRITGLIITMAALVVTVIYGPKKLMRSAEGIS